jgi:hypothetical protein
VWVELSLGLNLVGLNVKAPTNGGSPRYLYALNTYGDTSTKMKIFAAVRI